MENVLHYEQKMLIFKDLLFIDNEESLKQIHMFIDKFLSEFQQQTEETEAVENEPEEHEEEFDAKKISFEAWNEQFIDDMDLNEFIPEYGMTLKEFRLKIYNSERSEGMSKKEFIKKVNQW